MNIRNPYHEIVQIRDNIINYTLVFGTVLGILAFVVSFLNYNSSDFRVAYIVEFIVLSVLGVLSVKRERISLNVKIAVLIISLLTLIYLDIVKLGVFSDSKILFLFIPFFSILVLDLKKTLYIYAAGILGFLGMGLLFYFKILIPQNDLNVRAELYNPWVINAILISIVAVFEITIIFQFYKSFMNLVNNYRWKNEELSKSEQNYKEIFNSTTDAIFIHDLDAKIIDVNDATVNMYGFSKEEIIENQGCGMNSENEHYTLSDAMNHFKDVLATGKTVFDWQARRKDGTVFWVEIVLKKTHLLGTEKILAIVRDEDERKRISLQLEKYKNKLELLVAERTEQLGAINNELYRSNEELLVQSDCLEKTLRKLEKTQKHLLHSEKMASLGILSAGVAHEINNPLNFILGGITGMEYYIEDNHSDIKDNFTEFFSVIGEGVERVASIVESLNQYSRQSDVEDEVCDIHSIIDHCIVILYNQLKNKIEIVKRYESRKSKIVGNGGKLHQAILNIIANAEQAIADNGKIEIITEQKNEFVKISIVDNGMGMSQDMLSKITDPFFTTKEAGRGTGLGLSITYGIIKDHGGRMEFSSELHEGTSVIIYLPILK